MSRMRYNPRPVRRLGRILLNALTVLSLLVCVDVVILGVRSTRVADCIGWEFSDDSPGSNDHLRANP